MFLVLVNLPAGVMAVIATMIPLFTYALARAFGLEAHRRLQFLGILCGLAGAFLIIVPRTSLPSLESVPWAILAFLTPLLFALANVFAARFRPPNTSSLALSGGMLSVAVIAFAPVVWATGSFYTFQIPFGIAEFAIRGK